MSKEFYIWEGIYTSFLEASSESIGPGFNGETYNRRALTVAHDCLNALSKGQPIPAFHKQRSMQLPTVVAMMMNNTKALKILDFGGGLGIGYMTLSESLPGFPGNIEYSIVEVPNVCNTGSSLMPNIKYLDSLPSQCSFDLIHSASALQYIENWQHVVKLLVGYGAKYILLSDVFTGGIPTFVSLQNYYESKIPHWFFNFQELLEVFSSLDYQLVMKTSVSSKRLNTEDILPMENFPVSHRLEQTCHLLFCRVD